jgi:UDP-glucose:(heptosyl)LPS alpha-1,3-glucosyltransferase
MNRLIVANSQKRQRIRGNIAVFPRRAPTPTSPLSKLKGFGYNLALNMKVAMIIERANIALSGAERSVFELAGALQKIGLDVDILAGRGQTREKNMHILCPDSPRKSTGHLAFAKALKTHLADHRYDVIHSVLPFAFADVYQPRGGSYPESILRNAVSYENKCLTAYKRLTAFANFRRTARFLAERKLCKRAKGPTIAAPSEYVVRQFRKHYGLDNGRIAVIRNGVKTDRPVDTPRTNTLRAQILARLSLRDGDNPILLFFAANNFRLKGLAPLLRAMQHAAALGPDRPVYLIVTGGSRAHKYRRLARELDVHRRIVFLGPVRNIQGALSIIDVAILPTFYDPSSRFTLEALAAAKPVITTRFNGATDLFVNDRHGKIIDTPQDTVALANAINHFSDRDNIQRASAAIIEDGLKEKVSIMRAAQQLHRLYQQILRDRSKK